MKSIHARLVACATISILLAMGVLVPSSAAARNAPGRGTHSAHPHVKHEPVPTSSSRIAVDGAGAFSGASRVTEAQRSALALRLLAARERIAARVGTVSPPAGAELGPRGAPTTAAADSDVLQVRRNNRNTQASTVASTLAEPAAANDGFKVFYTGNTFASSSGDAGSTWAAVSLPGGPTDAPTACCDLDVVRAHAKGRVFTSVLYVNNALTNGVVRIFVRADPQAAPSCSYTVDPAGSADDVLPDYPHLAVSNNFLYLSTNNLTNDTSWHGAQVRRFNLAQMSACRSTATDTFDWVGSVGQRVLTPVEGATMVMYLGSNESATSFRFFSWPESSTGVTTGTRVVGASTFANPDCRGGVGNFDFIERSTAWSIAGFRLRGATGGGRVTFWWPVAPDADHPQAHLHGATLRTRDLALAAQPPVWSRSTCFGYPAVASNVFGEYGMSMAVGGRAGGGGTAAQGSVLVDDADSPGIFFPTYRVTAAGTHNRSDGRFGDYFTVRTNSRCTSAWVATNYALLNGSTTSAHVNARYVEMQSSRRPLC